MALAGGEPIATGALAETPRPSYDRLGQALTTLLSGSGCGVRDGFPRPHHAMGTLAFYEHATRELVLHPWISPRGRVEALLHETVGRLGEKQAGETQARERGKEWRDLPRTALVTAALTRRWGMAPIPDGETVELTAPERSLVDRIAAAVEDPVLAPR